MTVRSLRFALAALVGALALVGVSGLAANAATYPPSTNAITIEGGGSVGLGDSVTINAATFKPGSDVTFTISSPLSSLGSSRGGASLVDAAESGTCATGSTCVRVAGSDGVATALVSFTQAGKQTVTATGTGVDGDELTVTSTVTVADDAGAGSPGDDSDPDAGGLANTGSDVITYGVIGIALVAAGAVLVVALRRRTPSRHAA